MIGIGAFWAFSTSVYLLLVLVVGMSVDATPLGYALCALHALLAATLNAAIVGVVKLRRLSLIGGPLVTALVSTATYFTFSLVKYLAPNPVYGPIFELTVGDRFVGSLLAAFAIGLGICVLAWLGAPQRQLVHAVLSSERLSGGVLTCLWLIATAGKVLLWRAGYGSAYSQADHSLANPDSYGALVLVSLVPMFDYASFMIALVLGWRLLSTRSPRPLWALVAAAVSGTLAWAVFVKARMPFVHLALMVAFSLQAVAWRRAVLALQVLLVALPTLALVGSTTLPAMLGRENVQATDALDVVAQIGYRADLTDLAMAFALRMRGEVAGAAVVIDALAVSVPRVVWPSKDAFYADTYYGHLDRHGFPPIDYLETPFSNGYIAFGWPGFVLWPLGWWTAVALAGAALARVARGRVAFQYVLLMGSLVLMRVEMEWVGAMLQVRDALMFSMAIAVIVVGVRGVRASLRLFGGGTRLQGPRHPQGPAVTNAARVTPVVGHRAGHIA